MVNKECSCFRFELTSRPQFRKIIRKSTDNPIAVLTLVFALSRIVFALAGIRYTINFHDLWHIAEPGLLRDHLLQTLFYLHEQPPLLNLLVGIILKLFPSDYAIVFNGIFIGVGLAISIVLYKLMTHMGVGKIVALIMVLIFMVSPASILYENLFFYDYLLAALLIASAFLLFQYLTIGRLRYLVLFFVLLAVIVLTRSLFHLSWLLLVMVLLMILRRDQWKKIVLAGCIPCMLAVSIYVKNLVVFGNFGGSTWFGMNMARVTICQLDSADRAAMVRNKELSPLSLIPPFSNLSSYQRSVGTGYPTGIPTLDRPLKRDWLGCSTNFNNLAYIEISRQYGRDAQYVLTHRPGAFGKAIMLSSFYYFYPASVHFLLDSNRARISWYERIFDLAIYGQLYDYQNAHPHQDIPDSHGVAKIFKVGIMLVIGIPLLLLYGIRSIRQNFNAGLRGRALSITLAFIVGTMLWIMVVGILFECGENYRFRFMTEPYCFLLLGLFLSNRPWKKSGVMNGVARADGTVAEFRQADMLNAPGAIDGNG
ncbi:MAG: hypothetical protein JWQ98_2981 [Chlorobi bacterium]|nr:hypothetical protein [Chlorobiota bacterium]